MTRPTKLTEELIEAISGHISQGITPEVAVQIEEVSPRTYYNWIEKAKDGKEPYVQFLQSLTRAKVLMRAKIEFELAETDARFFATRSPIMRETSDVPGWHNFEKQPQLQVNVVTVSSIIDDALESLPESVNILELPNLKEEEIKFIGEGNSSNSKNGHKNGHNTDS